ncbi:MAG: histidine phosphatase family protein [Clostridia bacterium]|nr:histidine phosphatase family protein [Clostridia bacterium]
MKIYVIRHGETDVNVENKINALNDDDLNENGANQAKALRKIVEKIDYDFIISSPLRRTKHTAELLNAKELPIYFNERLLERDAGKYTKALISSINRDDWWRINPKEDYEDAETVKNLILRIEEFLNEIKIKYQDKNIILVTHGGVSKAIRCYFEGIPEDGNLRVYKHDNCEIKEYEL